MGDGIPSWARRIRALREARGWSQAEAAERMREHSRAALPDPDHLLRRWKAWERGENKPSPHYAPLIAAALHTVTTALFPPEHRARAEILGVTGTDTMEIVSRLRASSVDEATVQALRITVDRLCSEYAHRHPDELLVEGREWLRRIVDLQEQRLGFRQRRDTLELAGWLALLVGCLEYDTGDRRSAEATRQAALSLGQEVGSAGVLGWAHEMRAWFALTSGDHRGAVAAARAGRAVSGGHSVGVQLLAQEAKAWARMGRPAEMEDALERGRVLLDSLPYPDNVDNHFVVDPSKFDFYAMDCYRHVGDDRLASALANEVIRGGTDFNGFERSPMRIAEARITLGVAAAREGDLEGAVAFGRQALTGQRKSLPSLAMVSQDLAAVLSSRFSGETEAEAYLAQLREIHHAR
ncbi:transcriptional regulator with XRE-family HTH domain [Saccharothrix coeruleofusca]|uniref:helix-turn-helix domain-containing protein n=1 Tax=Saccharothrix coeruleofusca TaxID=33919 RepID=UPI001AE57D16|nr:helix-turn-helix transcriptional regulator [Saccharothrix coeruleofusca]MBP2336560.1 transcriptional regulator with XRE-family HTH domain [Saccharothrix coeruleofusca]